MKMPSRAEFMPAVHGAVPPWDAGHPSSSTLYQRFETVICRQVQTAQVPALKKSAFELMTRLAFIARAPTEPEQPAIRRDSPWTGLSDRQLRSAERPQTAIAPALRPGHKERAVRGATPSCQQLRNRVHRSAWAA